jgi:sigma-54 dependent transcriptional regulator, acetoin dehydrogenase operon transcriptional activator AcoR
MAAEQTRRISEQVSVSNALGTAAPIELPPAVALSWQRCAQRGLSAAIDRPLAAPAALAPVESTWAAHQRSLVRPVLEDLYQFIEGSGCVVAFVDADGRALDTVGDPDAMRELAAIEFAPGGCWNEECAGTSGVALALTEAFPMQVSGRAHYCAFLRPYCTSAAPVHDSLGALVGALVAIGRAERCHPHTLAMVAAAAASLTGELRMNLWLASANELLSELNAILQTLSEGIMLLQGDGAISQMNARAGKLLGLVPARVTGQRLQDVLEVPASLAAALHAGREMHDEEVTFRAGGGRVHCLCTLRAIAAPGQVATPAPSGQPGAFPWGLGPAGGGVLVAPRPPATRGYVLTLRSIERVQRLVHRMSGAQARMTFANIVGQSPVLLEAVRLARIAAESSSTVLLHGETGTGKEIFAQSVHSGSVRADGPFVAINCAAIPRELISSELFGYEGGAFTGADRQGRPGKFELAHGGTLFLDEIGDMPRDLQTSLLRAIETHSIVRVGGQMVMPVDVRIIAATHKDLAEEVQLGNFRSDLFFRLNVFTIEIPPLRERPGDIPLLLRHSLEELSTRLGRALGVDAEVLVALEAYPWPGNVRELENTIERAVYVAERSLIALRDLPEPVRAAVGALHAVPVAGAVSVPSSAPSSAPSKPIGEGMPIRVRNSLRRRSASAEAALIQQALESSGGSIMEAARLLGISRTTLWRKQLRYGLRTEPVEHRTP